MSRFMFVILLLTLSMFNFIIGKSVFTCPEEDIMTGCKDPTMCIYADPSNCNGFIQCNDDGQVFHQKCNVGLVWNDAIKNCDKPRRHSYCYQGGWNN